MPLLQGFPLPSSYPARLCQYFTLRKLLYENGFAFSSNKLGFPGGSVGKESACTAGDVGSFLMGRRGPWRRKRQPTPVFFPGESHGQRSLAGYSPPGCKESDRIEANEHSAHTYTKCLAGERDCSQQQTPEKVSPRRKHLKNKIVKEFRKRERQRQVKEWIKGRRTSKSKDRQAERSNARSKNHHSNPNELQQKVPVRGQQQMQMNRIEAIAQWFSNIYVYLYYLGDGLLKMKTFGSIPRHLLHRSGVPLGNLEFNRHLQGRLMQVVRVHTSGNIKLEGDILVGFIIRFL